MYARDYIPIENKDLRTEASVIDERLELVEEVFTAHRVLHRRVLREGRLMVVFLMSARAAKIVGEFDLYSWLAESEAGHRPHWSYPKRKLILRRRRS